MHEQTIVPVARPSPPPTFAAPPIAPIVTAHPMVPSPPPLPPMYAPPPGYAIMPVRPRTDSMAVASAVCGFTGIIPIVCQVAGLALGILSLLRIRRSRLMGAPLGGAPWAISGIVLSGVGLLGWIAMFGAMSSVSSSFGSSSDLLGTLMKQVQP
jgi:hypothetical protein